MNLFQRVVPMTGQDPDTGAEGDETGSRDRKSYSGYFYQKKKLLITLGLNTEGIANNI